MKILGASLVVIGVCWIVICFLGTMMLARSVNMFTEAVLPALLGVVVDAIGVMMIARGKPGTQD